MKAFNADLNKDINKLSALHALKDKTRFNALKNEIMLKHSISKATVYRELKKDTPGLYKQPDYNPPQRAITEQEIAMVKELLLRKIPVMDLGRIIESETGNKCNWDRIDKIRSIIDTRLKSGQSTALDSPAETMFGSNVKRLCEEVLKCNYMAENSSVSFEVNGKQYSLCYSDVKDIALICSMALVRLDAGSCDYLTMARDKIWYILNEKLNMITSANMVTTKELLMLKSAVEEFEQSYMDQFLKNFSVIWYVAHELAPDASYSKVIELTQKYSNLFPEFKITGNPPKAE